MSTTTTTLSDLFAPIVESKPARKPRRKAEPVTIVSPEGDRKTHRPTKAQFLADSFRAWAQATADYDGATLRLVSILVNDDSVSARKASEIAVEALGANRGWSKDKITALRWTAPVWALACADASDRPVDEDDAPITVEALIGEVRTLCSRLGKARVDEALDTVDEPSVVAYVTALRDAEFGTNSAPADEAEAVADEDADDEAEAEPVTTDADRIQAVLNTLSGLEFDATLADALPALIDAVSAIAGKVTAPATV